MEPRYLFMPVAPELGPMFVIHDEPTSMDVQLASLEIAVTIIRLSDRAHYNPNSQEWESSPTPLPELARLPVGVLDPPAESDEDQIHVHPSMVSRPA